MPDPHGDTQEQLIDHLTEARALVRRGTRTCGRQGEAASVRDQPETEATVREIRDRLEEHAGALERRLSDLGHTADGRQDQVGGSPESTGRASEVLEEDQ